MPIPRRHPQRCGCPAVAATGPTLAGLCWRPRLPRDIDRPIDHNGTGGQDGHRRVVGVAFVWVVVRLQMTSPTRLGEKRDKWHSRPDDGDCYLNQLICYRTMLLHRVIFVPNNLLYVTPLLCMYLYP